MKKPVKNIKKLFGHIKKITCLPSDNIDVYKNMKIPKKDWPKVYPGTFPNSGLRGFSLDWHSNRGFGSYVFFVKDGKLYCQNECDDKDAIKEILCAMVDNSILMDKK